MSSNAHTFSSSRPSQSGIMHKYLDKALKAIMKSQRVQLPNYDLPMRLRPWFLVFTVVIMILFAFLGFTDATRSLPLNDKFLHFTCLCLATGVFYFIFDVEEDARRIWFWRHSGLIFTAITCFFFGGFVSEVVQSQLANQEFDFGDVVANMLGSAIGLYASYQLEKRYRIRREVRIVYSCIRGVFSQQGPQIARLYRPLDTGDLSEDYSDDEMSTGTQLLPLFNSHHPPNSSNSRSSKPQIFKSNRLGDVWDEREDLFGIGDDDNNSEDGHDIPPPSRHVHQHSQASPPPKIIITGS
ncbi:hypothetical protein ID866_3510 [Astraeus odoratus]|nr:hypothetical protein ID866_3510 [Astraeus odoratus]